MNHMNRSEKDRRSDERRTETATIDHHCRRQGNRRGYLDRRRDPAWRERWLRTRVVSVLRD